MVDGDLGVARAARSRFDEGRRAGRSMACVRGRVAVGEAGSPAARGEGHKEDRKEEYAEASHATGLTVGHRKRNRRGGS